MAPGLKVVEHLFHHQSKCCLHFLKIPLWKVTLQDVLHTLKINRSCIINMLLTIQKNSILSSIIHSWNFSQTIIIGFYCVSLVANSCAFLVSFSSYRIVWAPCLTHMWVHSCNLVGVKPVSYLILLIFSRIADKNIL